MLFRYFGLFVAAVSAFLIGFIYQENFKQNNAMPCIENYNEGWLGFTFQHMLENDNDYVQSNGEIYNPHDMIVRVATDSEHSTINVDETGEMFYLPSNCFVDENNIFWRNLN